MEQIYDELTQMNGEPPSDEIMKEFKEEFERLERERIDELLLFCDDQYMPEEVADKIQELIFNRAVELMGFYNRDIVPMSAEDYGQSKITGDFEDDYKKLRQEPHPGVDMTGGAFETPYYTIYNRKYYDTKSSNPFVLLVPGTNLMMRVKHADKKEVNTLRSKGSFYKPGESIIPFPNENNPGIPHFHLEITDIIAGVVRFVDPIGLSVGKHLDYKYNKGTLEKPIYINTDRFFGRR
jgi:hypothetical protein